MRLLHESPQVCFETRNPWKDSIYAATWALWIEDLDEDIPARQLRLGFDEKGRLLEIVLLIFDSGNELIIHSMKARPHMKDLLP